MTVVSPFTPTSIGSVSRTVNVIKLSYLQFNAPPPLAAIACSYLAFVRCKIPTYINNAQGNSSTLQYDVTRKHSVRQFYAFYVAKILRLVITVANRKEL